MFFIQKIWKFEQVHVCFLYKCRYVCYIVCIWYEWMFVIDLNIHISLENLTHAQKCLTSRTQWLCRKTCLNSYTGNYVLKHKISICTSIDIQVYKGHISSFIYSIFYWRVLGLNNCSKDIGNCVATVMTIEIGARHIWPYLIAGTLIYSNPYLYICIICNNDKFEQWSLE